jgi:serine/threonine protein kinase
LAASPEKSLAEILAHRMQSGVPVPVPLALTILRQVCDALEWAHNLCDPEGRPLGIIHRDVSPSYILVADTGLVRLVGSTAERPNAAYLAPELISSGMLDARADLFALGVVAHELLANRPLFATADERETLERVCMLAIPSPSSFNPAVPPDLDSIVLMALSRDPAYRWQHAAMMRDGLLSVMQRLGFELAPLAGNPWADLLASQAVAAAPPELPSVQFATRESPPPQQLLRQPPPRQTPMRAATDPAVLEFMATMGSDPDAAQIPDQITEPIPERLPQPAGSAPIAPPPNHGFELDIPEGTQIGAVPLVEFGETSRAVIGEPPKPRANKPTLPQPMATFLPQADEPAEPRSRKRLLIAIAAIVILIAGALIAILLVVE